MSKRSPASERAGLALEGSTGIGTPLGWLGAGAVVRPVRWLDLHGGGGLGTEGIQIEAGARGRIVLDRRTALGLGAGWSSGRFVAIAQDPSFLIWPNMNRREPPMRYFGRAHFVNLEVSMERAFQGYRARPFLGLGAVVNPHDGVLVNARCTPESCPMSRFVLVPYIGVAVAIPLL